MVWCIARALQVSVRVRESDPFFARHKNIAADLQSGPLVGTASTHLLNLSATTEMYATWPCPNPSSNEMDHLVVRYMQVVLKMLYSHYDVQTCSIFAMLYQVNLPRKVSTTIFGVS